MGMRMREHSRYVPFMVTKCYQTTEDWLQNDSLTVAGSAPNLERKTAQKALFVQEIRPLGTSYSPPNGLQGLFCGCFELIFSVQMSQVCGPVDMKMG